MAAPVNVSVAPAHKEEEEGVAETPVGIALTVIADAVTVVLPQPFVATRVYTPAEAVLTVNDAGLSNVELKLPGPLHE